MTNTPMWTPTHFPAAMRSLSPSTRAKAIEIANRLLEQGALDKQRVIAFSVSEARQWARLAQASPVNPSWQPHV
ncbi:DUF2188 domain-containing protein [Spirosoma agri]|nr:hypothetical protein [Spirosoma agri]